MDSIHNKTNYKVKLCSERTVEGTWVPKAIVSFVTKVKSFDELVVSRKDITFQSYEEANKRAQYLATRWIHEITES